MLKIQFQVDSLATTLLPTASMETSPHQLLLPSLNQLLHDVVCDAISEKHVIIEDEEKLTSVSGSVDLLMFIDYISLNYNVRLILSFVSN